MEYNFITCLYMLSDKFRIGRNQFPSSGRNELHDNAFFHILYVQAMKN